MLKRILSLSMLAALVLAACGDGADHGIAGVVPDGETPGDVSEKPDETTEDGKADRWNYANDPDRFDGGLNAVLAELPREGRAANGAWPSTYWPTYADSVQHRWNREFSPAEKYDRAFNGWTPPENFDQLRPYSTSRCNDEHDNWDREYYDNLGPLATHVSANMGNRKARDGRDSDGDGQIDECDDRDGVSSWWGLCHAWVPAAMLEDRPLRSVTHNGVTFHVGDLEALLILAYNRSPASMIGSRCNLFETKEEYARVNGCRLPDQEASEGDQRRECTEQQISSYVISRDEHGRVEQNQCRDTNAGAMHIIASNYLGLQQRPFAYDRTYDFEVWNQPIVAFNVARMEEVNPAQANELLGTEGETYEYNRDAVKLYDVAATLTYITESHASTTPADSTRYERQDHYTYILEVDGDGKIIGGEFYGNARELHPDFLWDPRRLDRSSVPNLDIENIRMLVELSRQPEVPVSGDVISVAGQGNVSIPDNNPAGVSSTATVSDSVAVADVRAELAIAHTYIGDLTITLSHGGIDRVIHAKEGGSDNDIRRTITVPGFDGVDAAGAWTLHVVDSAGQDVGKIESWTLHITPGDGEPTPGGGGTEPGTTEGDFSGTGTGGPIPDNDESGLTSTINLSGTGAISGVNVAIDVTHTYVGDLLVTLSHGGTTATVHNRIGGGRDDIDKAYPIDAFNGIDAAGEWTLSVVDAAGQDVGTLNSWGLEVHVGDAPLEPTPEPGAPETYPGTGNLPIPDNTPAGITSEAGVPAGATGAVAVAVNITHTWRGDLKVAVVHGEQTWTLHENTGGSADNLVETYVLDPAPTGDVGGTWSLTVSDSANADTGTLDSWSVIVTP